jgi:hypothetical protein
VLVSIATNTTYLCNSLEAPIDASEGSTLYSPFTLLSAHQIPTAAIQSGNKLLAGTTVDDGWRQVENGPASKTVPDQV